MRGVQGLRSNPCSIMDCESRGDTVSKFQKNRELTAQDQLTYVATGDATSPLSTARSSQNGHVTANMDHSGETGVMEGDLNALLRFVPKMIIGDGLDTSGLPMYPYGVTVDPVSDNIFVVDNANHRVCVYTSDGRYISSFGRKVDGYTGLISPRAITIDTRGRILVTDNHRVNIFTTAGKWVTQFGEEEEHSVGLRFPWGLTTDSSNNVYVCDHGNHQVRVYSDTGRHLRVLGEANDGTLQYPRDVCVSRTNGELYVTSDGLQTITIYTRSGQYTRSIGAGDPSLPHIKPMFLAINEHNHVFVTDESNHCVQVFHDDVHVYSIGDKGSEQGCFSFPRGITINRRGDLVVCDRHNHRVQVIQCYSGSSDTTI